MVETPAPKQTRMTTINAILPMLVYTNRRRNERLSRVSALVRPFSLDRSLDRYNHAHTYLLSRRRSGCIISGSLLCRDMVPGLGLPVQSLGRDQVFPYPQVLSFSLSLLPRVPLPCLAFPFLALALLLLRDGDWMRRRRTWPGMMMAYMRCHCGMRRGVRPASWWW